MSNSLIWKISQKHLEDVEVSLQIEQVMDRMLRCVEWKQNLSIEFELSKELSISMNHVRYLLSQIKIQQEEKAKLEIKLTSIAIQAEDIRDQVVVDIGSVLRESRQVFHLKEQINSLQKSLYEANSELESLQLAIKTYQNQSHENSLVEKTEVIAVVSEVPATPKREDNNNIVTSTTTNKLIPKSPWKPSTSFVSILHELEGTKLLYVVSFLQTVDVLSAAQVSKFVYCSVYRLFGIESQYVKPDWSKKPLPPPKPQVIEITSPTPLNQSPMVSNGNNLTNPSVNMNNSLTTPLNFAETLSKKLTAPELKIIVQMTDKLKKQTADIEDLRVEKEDLNAKLQNVETIKDFFVEKLRTAEVALRACMNENSNLKRQALADQEVISYLDLRVQELDTLQQETIQQRDQLKATVELQINSHDTLEDRLTSELEEYKKKLQDMEDISKNQKKILAKEIKSLRSQNMKLVDEKNVYATRLNVLRETLNLNSFALKSSDDNTSLLNTSLQSVSYGMALHRSTTTYSQQQQQHQVQSRKTLF